VPDAPRLLTASHAERQAILAFGGVHVRISRGHPRGTPSLPVIRELWPSRELLDGFQAQEIGYQEWHDRYRGEIEPHAVAIEQRLGELAGEHPDAPLVLCCFERVERGEHCHRRVFAEWWEERTGVAVPELSEVTA
jgi:uncharacterized protein YeaO (DUF488 family)